MPSRYRYLFKHKASRFNPTVASKAGNDASTQYKVWNLLPHRQAEAAAAVLLLVCRPWISTDLSQPVL
ncbi:TPA: hypothetical protein ACH3X2_001341 [Trebouxia sp. C0005]